jgi:hypothetical protein
LISSGSLFLASATLTFIASMIAIYYSYVKLQSPTPASWLGSRERQIWLFGHD